MNVRIDRSLILPPNFQSIKSQYWKLFFFKVSNVGSNPPWFSKPKGLMICHWICEVLKHTTCLHIKIDFIYLGLVIDSLVPHSPYNPSPWHLNRRTRDTYRNEGSKLAYTNPFQKMMVSILSAYNFLTKHLRETCIK